MFLKCFLIGGWAIQGFAAPVQEVAQGTSDVDYMESLLASLKVPEPSISEPESAKTNTIASSNSLKPDATKAEAIKEAFRHAWNGYYEQAFPHDEVYPVSGRAGDSRYFSEVNPAQTRANFKSEMDGGPAQLTPCRLHSSWRKRRS